MKSASTRPTESGRIRLAIGETEGICLKPGIRESDKQPEANKQRLRDAAPLRPEAAQNQKSRLGRC
jgi:orotidine-5'-phosphate decarboxylase